VVAQEILAGAKTQQERTEYRRFIRQAEHLGLSIAPRHEDWLRAGELLARYAWRWGALEPAKHINDILILLTARWLGAELLSDNLRDMLSWARMLDPQERRVTVRSASHI